MWHLLVWHEPYGLTSRQGQGAPTIDLVGLLTDASADQSLEGAARLTGNRRHADIV